MFTYKHRQQSACWAVGVSSLQGETCGRGLVVGGGDVLPEFRHFMPTTGELLHARSGLVGVPLSYGGARVICCRS